MIDRARAGQSAVTVLRGEPGIGKTAILQFVQDQSADCRTARASGIQAEMELPFAGLHQLCSPFLDRLDRLPGPQRHALATAFGLSDGDPPDRFLVGLATLSLLAEVAGEQPLICLIDDVQWWDRTSVQTLAFVARRLLAEPIMIIFATRADDDADLRGLQELRLTGLNALDAGALLDHLVPGRLDDHVRSRIIAETGGNPLALEELPRSLDPKPTGGFDLPRLRPITEQLEDGYVRQFRDLPAAARQLLQVAAVEPTGDAGLLWRAVATLDLDPEVAAPAEAAGLIRIGTRVRFRHPLLRATIYAAATPQERQRAHRALAEVIDIAVDPDRRAWHRALSTPETDEQVAAELVASAERARQRGGAAAEAAFLERAVVLTPDRGRKAVRALAAAQAKLRVGAVDDALGLLAIAESNPLEELDRARADLVRAQSRFTSDRGRDAAPLLLAAAQRLERLDPRLSRETYLEAISAAMFAGRLAGAANVEAVARSARSGPSAVPPVGLGDQLLDGLSMLFTDGYVRSVPSGEAMLRGVRSSRPTAKELRYLWLAGAAAADLWDDESWQLLASEHVRMARQTGALAELPLALHSRAMVHLFAGELGAASSLVAEIPAVTAATGTRVALYAVMGLAAWRGDEGSARTLIETSLADVSARGEGVGVASSHWSSTILDLGLGNFRAALESATQAAADPTELAIGKWAMADQIEAAVLAGHPEVAAGVLEQLVELTSASGSAWALGVQARARALLAHSANAGDHYREAISNFSRTRMLTELARTHLLFGEWLARTGIAAEAHDQLQIAHHLFSTMGATGFSQRARRSLREIGGTVPTRTSDSADTLTAQEAQIAHLARDGLTNPEIGAQLFLSRHTVEWHLRKVYSKLGIRSRKQLVDRLPPATRSH